MAAIVYGVGAFSGLPALAVKREMGIGQDSAAPISCSRRGAVEIDLFLAPLRDLQQTRVLQIVADWLEVESHPEPV
jgi:hypothetical protein